MRHQNFLSTYQPRGVGVIQVKNFVFFFYGFPKGHFGGYIGYGGVAAARFGVSPFGSARFGDSRLAGAGFGGYGFGHSNSFWGGGFGHYPGVGGGHGPSGGRNGRGWDDDRVKCLCGKTSPPPSYETVKKKMEEFKKMMEIKALEEKRMRHHRYLWSFYHNHQARHPLG